MQSPNISQNDIQALNPIVKINNLNLISEAHVVK